MDNSIGNNMHQEKIVICDYGSQYTFLIARKLRELGIYSEIVDGRSTEAPSPESIRGIILSGSPDSVKNQDAAYLPRWVLEGSWPVLGICYGMQVLSHALGGSVESNEKREYGRESILTHKVPSALGESLFKDTPTTQVVWMSHGDDVRTLPSDFEVYAQSESGTVAAIIHKTRPLMGIQFHPEVHHSEFGSTLLLNFARRICKMESVWSPTNIIEQIADRLKRELTQDSKLVLAISGGVDSTVCAVLLTKILGPQKVTCLFVDHGLLREGEAEETFANLKALHLNVHLLERSDLFLQNLSGKADPEEKRKIIGRTFIEVFEDFVENHSGFTHLVQGTLYPDVIESAGTGSKASVIKSHHNVGGLPAHLKLTLLEPFRLLFKDEVRQIGKELQLSPTLTQRHPFPGPGLAIRIVGEVTAEKVRIARKADHIFIDSLRREGFYDKIWQAGVVLLPVKSVGVMGDERSYEWVCSLRAVHAVDAMTAHVGELPLSFLCKVADQIVRNVRGINRVLYDITSKPPATIEWE
jgi:GMP synthase (glutamine-hydrolysing)